MRRAEGEYLFFPSAHSLHQPLQLTPHETEAQTPNLPIYRLTHPPLTILHSLFTLLPAFPPFPPFPIPFLRPSPSSPTLLTKNARSTTFNPSSMTNTGALAPSTAPHSPHPSGTMLNKDARKGTYSRAKCRAMDRAMAYTRTMFRWRGRVRRDSEEESAFMALSISMTTRMLREIVEAVREWGCEGVKIAQSVVEAKEVVQRWKCVCVCLASAVLLSFFLFRREGEGGGEERRRGARNQRWFSLVWYDRVGDREIEDSPIDRNRHAGPQSST